MKIQELVDKVPETLLKAIETGISFVTQPIVLFAEINSYLTQLSDEVLAELAPLGRLVGITL